MFLFLIKRIKRKICHHTSQVFITIFKKNLLALLKMDFSKISIESRNVEFYKKFKIVKHKKQTLSFDI